MFNQICSGILILPIIKRRAIASVYLLISGKIEIQSGKMGTSCGFFHIW